MVATNWRPFSEVGDAPFMHRSECNFAHHLNFIIDINIKRKLWHKMRYKSGYMRTTLTRSLRFSLSLSLCIVHHFIQATGRLHLSCRRRSFLCCPVKDIMEMMSAGACWPLLSRSARQRPIDQCLVIGRGSRAAAEAGERGSEESAASRTEP